jgi:SecD/SecF fusion protein
VKSRFLHKRKSWFGVKKADIHDISEKEEPEPTIFNRQPNIVQHRKKFIFATLILVVIGTASLVMFQINPGIDFTSGSRIEILAEESLETEEVENALADLDLQAQSVIPSGENNEAAVARFDTVLSESKIAEVAAYFMDAYGNEPSVSVVSPIVGEELVENAIYAVAIASVFMIIYVAFRFELIFGITAVIALLHDAFFMLVVFSITQIEFEVTIIAAILTIIGYSINATIVTFDRIRENVRKKKRVKSFKELADIVNKSLIQTFTRTINTTFSTLIAVMAFLVLGAESIFGFAVALAVGLFAGTYSSLFLASQLWLSWRGKNISEKPIDFTKKKRVEGPQV